jgi:hypothetical protein
LKRRNAWYLAALLPGVLIVTPPASADAPPQKVSAVSLVTPPAGSIEEAKQLVAKAPKAEEYPNAASAMLLDLADIEVRPNGAAYTFTRQAKKIFNKRGRDDESEIKIPYNSTYEKITIKWARTIKPDGTVIEVKPEDIRDSRPSDYDDVAVKAFSMPAVDDDCIIDYAYITEQKESQMPGQFWSQWYFQGGFDPVMKTKLTVKMPKSLKLNEQILNTPVKPSVKDLPGGKDVLYTWEDKNVAALELEPMMPDVDKVLPKLYISTVPTWDAISQWYYDLAKDRMVPDDSVKATTKDLIAGKTTPEEKAKTIFYYVEEKTRYVSIDLGKSAYQPHPASSTLANKFGDCKDMTTLLVAMLREAGIDANPVLLKMGSKDKRSAELPSPGAFDHAICLAVIDGKDYWLDATAATCPWGIIPNADRGCEVLVVRDGGKGEWKTVPFGEPSDNQNGRDVKLTLAPDGSATGTISITGNGDTDITLRAILRDLPEAKRRPYMENLAQTVGANPRVTNITVSDYKDMSKPVTLTMDVTFPSWANQSGDLLLFKAQSDQTSGTQSSPFREDGRKYNISQDSNALGVSTLALTLPKGYTVLSLPKDTDIKSELGRYVRTVKQDGDTLNISVRGENYRADIPASRYDDARKYYDSYLKAAGESVILKKS